MAPIDGESLELEVKHKDDGSWHPCRVNLSRGDAEVGVIIDFDDSNEEDVISTREETLKRLRFRSTPIEDGECSSIREGDCVLAMYKDQFKSLFFDAVIVKPYRVKHSNRVFCRCTFEIKWINAELEDETITIPSKSILKLSKEKIDSHPTFSAFLKSLSSADGEEATSSFSLPDETAFEPDFSGLEKQIEEIHSKYVDGYMEYSSELPLEVQKANLGGHKQSKRAGTSRTSSNDGPNSFRRSTRSQNKEQVKVEVKKDLEDDNKSFLSPLALRAAFASFLHENEAPVKQELFSRVGKVGSENLGQEDSKEFSTIHSLNEPYKYVKSDASFNRSMTDFSNPIRDVEGISRNFKQKGTAKKNKSKDSQYQEKQFQAPQESESKKESGLTFANNSVSSTTVENLRGRATATRVTRSSVHKEIEASSDEGKQVSSFEKFTSYVQTTRLTRLRNQKEHSNPNHDHNFVKADLTRDADDIAEESGGKKRSRLTIANDSIDSTTVGNMSSPSMRRVTRSSMPKETEASSDEVEEDNSDRKLVTPASTTRLTRSRHQNQESNLSIGKDDRNTKIQNTKAISEESQSKKGRGLLIVNNSMDSAEVEKMSSLSMTTRVTSSSAFIGKETLSDDNDSTAVVKQSASSKNLTSPMTTTRLTHSRSGQRRDIVNASEGVIHKSANKKKREISCASDSNTDFVLERNKVMKTSDTDNARVPGEASDTILKDSEDVPGEKKDERKKEISAKKPELRSSPRLNFAPRTR